MLKLLSRIKDRIFPASRPEMVDANRIYAKVMKQSRNPVFYTQDLIRDDTDGRMEWLSAHLSVVMHALQSHGEDGAKLSQAIYDVMVDDFDIALREEGLSDSGVKHRIKPLAKMYLTRVRSYSQALNDDAGGLDNIVQNHVLQADEEKASSVVKLSDYLRKFAKILDGLGLDDIALAGFDFPAE